MKASFPLYWNDGQLTTGITLAAMSGKRTLQEWRVRTNSCLYLSVSSCSVTLFVLITSFFKTITNWERNRCHNVLRLFPLCLRQDYITIVTTWIYCTAHATDLFYIARRDKVQCQLQGLLSHFQVRSAENTQDVHHKVLDKETWVRAKL